MRGRAKKLVVGTMSIFVMLGLALLVARVSAGGAPASVPLSYSGILEGVDGAPLTGNHPIMINFWNSPEAGQTPLCQTKSESVSLDLGRFKISLPDTCTAAVRDHADIQVEVIVDGNSLGMQRLQPVPYALESSHAVTADSAAGDLLQQVVPAGAVMAFNRVECPAGWSAFTAGQGRTVVGVNTTPSELSAHALGDTFGEEAHALKVAELPSHAHEITDNGHQHTVGPPGPGNQLGQAFIYATGNVCGIVCSNPSLVGAFHEQTAATATTNIVIRPNGGGMPHNNMQPSVALLPKGLSAMAGLPSQAPAVRRSRRRRCSSNADRNPMGRKALTATPLATLVGKHAAIIVRASAYDALT